MNTSVNSSVETGLDKYIVVKMYGVCSMEKLVPVSK